MRLKKKFIKRLKEISPSFFFNSLIFLKHLPRNIQSFFLELKYRFLNRYFKNYGITVKKRKIPIIMSSTTFPKRINRYYLAIETILRQKCKPDYIYIWLAKDEFPHGEKELPKKLLDLKKRGVKIEFVDKNFRSNNKLFHALKKFPNAIIITFDDDCFYPTTFVKKFYEIHLKFPKDILCYDARQIKIDEKGNPLPYNEWFEYDKTTDSGRDILAVSVNGILYPPNSLSKKALDEKALMKLSLYNDDLWFKTMALLNGTKHRRIYKKNKSFPTILGTQKSGLFNINVSKNRNDKIIKDLFEKYELSKFFR